MNIMTKTALQTRNRKTLRQLMLYLEFTFI